MRTWKMEEGGHRKIGRTKLSWNDNVRKDMKEKGLWRENAKDGRRWRMKT